jgi:hypothetical protein
VLRRTKREDASGYAVRITYYVRSTVRTPDSGVLNLVSTTCTEHSFEAVGKVTGGRARVIRRGEQGWGKDGMSTAVVGEKMYVRIRT